MGAPVYPSQVEAKLVASGAEAARMHELEEQLAAAQAANTQARERARSTRRRSRRRCATRCPAGLLCGRTGSLWRWRRRLPTRRRPPRPREHAVRGAE